jgi:tetratricopeptide (TPR) repeat protein
LYNRALTAYERADYWDAIQLGREAVEVDEQVAEYYGLLGRALLQNKKWRKEAADNFLKATELEPSNIEFLGMLGAIYEGEGLTTRASSLLERAQAIDPDYEFPDLDGSEVITD